MKFRIFVGATSTDGRSRLKAWRCSLNALNCLAAFIFLTGGSVQAAEPVMP